MRNSAWVRWFNSFGFITVVVFSFAFLTTMEFPPANGKGRLPKPYIQTHSDGSQSPDRLKTITASRYGEAGDSDYTVRGYGSQVYTYNAW